MLLGQLGLRFEVLDVEVPEERAAGEEPAAYVERVARAKAAAGLAQVAAQPGAVVLGADTEVVLGGEVFGKPADAESARAMLRRLAGRTHEVLSVVCCAAGGRAEALCCRSLVSFAPLDETRIESCVASGEAFGKAGAYAIQGCAAAFITRLEGSYSGVVGLPLHETASLLARFGIDNDVPPRL